MLAHIYAISKSDQRSESAEYLKIAQKVSFLVSSFQTHWFIKLPVLKKSVGVGMWARINNFHLNWIWLFYRRSSFFFSILFLKNEFNFRVIRHFYHFRIGLIFSLGTQTKHDLTTFTDTFTCILELFSFIVPTWRKLYVQFVEWNEHTCSIHLLSSSQPNKKNIVRKYAIDFFPHSHSRCLFPYVVHFFSILSMKHMFLTKIR